MTMTAIIENSIAKAKMCNIKKVILFGSRATNTYHENSDFDLAVLADSMKDFYDYVDALEELPTLLMFDIINLSSDMISLDIQNSIAEEGIILYEAV